MALMVALIATAADVKTLRVTTEPPMSCSNCENKIKKNLRFEKGIKEITTDREHQVVTVVYDAEKTDEKKIVEAFGKIKYRATVLDGDKKAAAPACPASTGDDCCKKHK